MRKVLPGQPIQIAASSFNTMLDAAQDYRNRGQSLEAEALRPSARAGIIVVRNQSGVDRNRFDVLGLSSILISPTDNFREFAARFAMNAVTTATTHTQKFCVLQEPVKNGGLGRAMIVGITPV